MSRISEDIDRALAMIGRPDMSILREKEWELEVELVIAVAGIGQIFHKSDLEEKGLLINKINQVLRKMKV